MTPKGVWSYLFIGLAGTVVASPKPDGEVTTIPSQPGCHWNLLVGKNMEVFTKFLKQYTPDVTDKYRFGKFYASLIEEIKVRRGWEESLHSRFSNSKCLKKEPKQTLLNIVEGELKVLKSYEDHVEKIYQPVGDFNAIKSTDPLQFMSIRATQKWKEKILPAKRSDAFNWRRNIEMFQHILKTANPVSKEYTKAKSDLEEAQNHLEQLELALTEAIAATMVTSLFQPTPNNIYFNETAFDDLYTRVKKLKWKQQAEFEDSMKNKGQSGTQHVAFSFRHGDELRELYPEIKEVWAFMYPSSLPAVLIKSSLDPSITFYTEMGGATWDAIYSDPKNWNTPDYWGRCD